jgi:hypothetical protein
MQGEEKRDSADQKLNSEISELTRHSVPIKRYANAGDSFLHALSHRACQLMAD